MRTVVFDGSALLAHFLGQPGGRLVKAILADARRRQCAAYMSTVNLAESVYVVARGRGQEGVEGFLKWLSQLRVTIVPADRDDAIATVTIAKRATPAHVRFALSRKGGETIAELTAPFEAQVTVASAPQKEKAPLILVAPADLRTCRFVFDPSSLEPGEYEAKAELLGPQSKPIATKTVMLQRNRD